MSAGPRVRCGHRCPHCGRRSLPCDSLGRRRRGALDLGGPACRAGAEVMRVRCPEHGVVAEAVPWARHHTMFCRAFGDQVARLAPRMRGGAPDGPARVDWHTVFCQVVLSKWDCGGMSWTKAGPGEGHMHSQERRRLATGILAEFDHSYAGTIAEFGYPTRSAPQARGGTGTRGPARRQQASLPRTPKSHRNLSTDRTGIGHRLPDSGATSVTSRRCPRMVGPRPVVILNITHQSVHDSTHHRCVVP